MKFLVLSILVVSQSVFAADAWEYCNAVSADLAIDSGELYSPSGEEWDMELVGLIYSERISKNVSYCTLEKGGYEVVATDETITREIYEVSIEGEIFEVEFECTTGFSGIPASDTCAGEEWIND